MVAETLAEAGVGPPAKLALIVDVGKAVTEEQDLGRARGVPRCAIRFMDLAEVHGQPQARRALEIAAAGDDGGGGGSGGGGGRDVVRAV